MKYQGLRQVFRVTEYRDGCVFRTKREGYAFVTIEVANNSVTGDIQYHSLSTKMMMELRMMKTMRKVADDTPDVVPVKIENNQVME